MEEQKPKTVKTIGLFIIIFSVFIIFSNVMGAIVFSFFKLGEYRNIKNEISDFNLIEFLFKNYVSMCITMVLIGLIFFFCGFYLRKYILWANKLLTYLSIILTIIIWSLMIAFFVMFSKQNENVLFILSSIISAILWSTPFILLIWYLNKPNIKKHFV